mgnify:CR=1 FL=1
MAKKTSWAVIIVGISAFVLVVGVVLVGVVGYVIYQQFAFQAKSATEMSADEEFEQIVARFDGQKPYLVIEDGEPVVGVSYNQIMTPQNLTDEQIANVLTFVMNTWGNEGEMITPDRVRKVRAAGGTPAGQAHE